MKSEKTYEELAKERDDLKAQIVQYADIKGHLSHHMLQNAYKSKQLEIKNLIKKHPR